MAAQSAASWVELWAALTDATSVDRMDACWAAHSAAGWVALLVDQWVARSAEYWAAWKDILMVVVKVVMKAASTEPCSAVSSAAC